jgi:hypothetical protein
LAVPSRWGANHFEESLGYPRLEFYEQGVHRGATRRVLQADKPDVRVGKPTLEVERGDERVLAEDERIAEHTERVGQERHVGVEREHAHVDLEQPAQIVEALQPSDVLRRQSLRLCGERALAEVAAVRAVNGLGSSAEYLAERLGKAKRESVVDAKGAKLCCQVDEQPKPAVVGVHQNDFPLS